jgi:predicted esterase
MIRGTLLILVAAFTGNILTEALIELSNPPAESFDAAWARLKKGRDYSAEKPGRFSIRYPGPRGESFENVVEVPAEYDPARPWPLRVQLHGGVGRPGPQAAQPGRPIAQHAPNRIAGEPQIYIYPSGWAYAQWWDIEQVDNILRAVSDVKKKLNVDESHIYLTGISDGATGAYYIAMKAPTVWSSILPLNGSVAVIRNPANGADGEMHANNLTNKPLFIVNGEVDRLYPVAHVEPHVRWFKSLGIDVVFRPQAGAGHNTTWWPSEREPFEQFVREHARDPHPPKLSWETERTDRFNRVHWLVIDEIGKGASNADLADAGFFRHAELSGRVDVQRNGNAFIAQTRGVRVFTLLLSPDVIDFAKPVSITVNGKELFRGAVRKDVAVLTKWAARDDDRTMLYAAELRVALP